MIVHMIRIGNGTNDIISVIVLITIVREAMCYEVILDSMLR